MEGWGKVKNIARYAGVSERTLEAWLKQGLKYTRLPSGLRLIKYQWIDEFLEGFANSSNQVDQIVNEVFSKM
jgi:predicted site-specific integrase-resolvase